MASEALPRRIVFFPRRIKKKVWPLVGERVIRLKELRWSRRMLTSPCTVREISGSSILAEQGGPIEFPILPPLRRPCIGLHFVIMSNHGRASDLGGCFLLCGFVYVVNLESPPVLLVQLSFCALCLGSPRLHCPVGLITSATVTLANGDNCPAWSSGGHRRHYSRALRGNRDNRPCGNDRE